jgi:hypothetical protein
VAREITLYLNSNETHINPEAEIQIPAIGKRRSKARRVLLVIKVNREQANVVQGISIWLKAFSGNFRSTTSIYRIA